MKIAKKVSRLFREAVRDEENINLFESTPLVLMHLGLVGIIWVGFSWAALMVCLITYAVRVFALTAGYHRYFSHTAFKTSRVFQFILAFVGCSSAQLGPLWWASHHRHHHWHSDTPEDVHSPRYKGFFWSHIGWLLCKKYATTELERVPDFAKYKELRWLDRFHVVAPLTLAFSLYGLGAFLQKVYPTLNTTGWQMVVWGFFCQYRWCVSCHVLH